MILEAIISALMNFATWVITLIPQLASVPIVGVSSLINILKYGLFFFPIELWLIAVANISFWIVASFSWSIIEWIYKKIPGVS